MCSINDSALKSQVSNLQMLGLYYLPIALLLKSCFCCCWFHLTFADCSEGLKSSHHLCKQLRVQGHESSVIHIFAVAFLQMVPQAGLEPGLARDVPL